MPLLPPLASAHPAAPRLYCCGCQRTRSLAQRAHKTFLLGQCNTILHCSISAILVYLCTVPRHTGPHHCNATSPPLAGAIWFSRGFKEHANEALRELELGYNEIKDEGACALAQVRNAHCCCPALSCVRCLMYSRPADAGAVAHLLLLLCRRVCARNRKAGHHAAAPSRQGCTLCAAAVHVGGYLLLPCLQTSLHCLLAYRR